MKSSNFDLVASIFAGTVCVIISYFICTMFFGEIETKTVKTISTSVSSSVADPDPEIFNYQAINPTVEVRVGGCTDDADDNCEETVNTTPDQEEGE